MDKNHPLPSCLGSAGCLDCHRHLVPTNVPLLRVSVPHPLHDKRSPEGWEPRGFSSVPPVMTSVVKTAAVPELVLNQS